MFDEQIETIRKLVTTYGRTTTDYDYLPIQGFQVFYVDPSLFPLLLYTHHKMSDIYDLPIHSYYPRGMISSGIKKEKRESLVVSPRTFLFFKQKKGSKLTPYNNLLLLLWFLQYKIHKLPFYYKNTSSYNIMILNLIFVIYFLISLLHHNIRKVKEKQRGK